MAYFYYEAVDFSGTRYRGFLRAGSKREIVEYLQNIGLQPIRVYRIPAIAYFLLRARPHLSVSELIEFLKGVGYGVKSGIPLLEILVSLQEEMGSRRARAFVEEVIMEISKGNRFSDVLKKYRFIPPMVISFVEVGEETGDLGDNLLRAAERLAFIQDVKRQIKGALVYPLFSLIVVLISLGVWMFFVIPKLAAFLKDLDIPIPFYTQILLEIAKHKNELLMAVFGFVILIFVMYILVKLGRTVSRFEIFNYLIGKLVLSLPVFGKLARDYNNFLVASLLSSLISAGLNMDVALSILKTTIFNGVYRRALDRIDEAIREGEGIANAFKEAGIFPPLFIRYVAIGEKTGTLDEQLSFLANYYKERMDSFLTVLPKVLEPMLLLIAGGIIVFMVIAVFVPIYSSIGKIIGGV